MMDDSKYKYHWLTLAQWRREKNLKTASIIDGVKYMLAYNDEIGTHLQPIKVIGVDAGYIG